MPHLNTITLDVTKKEVESLKVGAKFEATVRGKIVELEAEREFDAVEIGGKKDKKQTFPATARIELSSVKVTQPNKFSALVEDDDEGD